MTLVARFLCLDCLCVRVSVLNTGQEMLAAVAMNLVCYLISLPRLSMCACVCVEHWPGDARCRSHESSLLPGRVAVGYNRGQVVC